MAFPKTETLSAPQRPTPPKPTDHDLSSLQSVRFRDEYKVRLGSSSRDALSQDEARFAWSADGQSLLVRLIATGQEVEVPRSACLLYFGEADGKSSEQRYAFEMAEYEKNLQQYQALLGAKHTED